MALPMLFKGRNRVTQPYTWPGGRNRHGGIDIVGDDDRTVLCVVSGKVIMANRWDGKTKTGTQSYGNLIVIQDGSGNRHYYAHLDSFSVSLGDYVSVGEKIGVMGNTGNSFGAHTHYEVRTGADRNTRTNPTAFVGVDNRTGIYESSAIKFVVPNVDLNIRLGAGVSYGVSYTDGAKANEEYGIVREKKSGTQMWGKLDDGRGWICLAYCREPGESAGKLYTITCDWLRVHKMPNFASKTVGYYSRGEKFEVIDRKGNWCQLKSGNWMCAGKWLKGV